MHVHCSDNSAYVSWTEGYKFPSVIEKRLAVMQLNKHIVADN